MALAEPTVYNARRGDGVPHNRRQRLMTPTSAQDRARRSFKVLPRQDLRAFKRRSNVEVSAMRKTSRARTKCVAAEASANPVLLYIALSLLTLLGILEADLHRDTLKGWGVSINSEFVDSRFVGP